MKKQETLRENVYKLIGFGYEDSVIAARLSVTVDIVKILREERKEK